MFSLFFTILWWNHAIEWASTIDRTFRILIAPDHLIQINLVSKSEYINLGKESINFIQMLSANVARRSRKDYQEKNTWNTWKHKHMIFM